MTGFFKVPFPHNEVVKGYAPNSAEKKEILAEYLALKNHFTKKSYDYHKYCGKSRATVQSFYKRKDRFWFEKVVRQKTDKEVVEFFVANFAKILLSELS